MIISHKLKCIFIAIPKTATHAIRFALREHLDESDEEQVGLFVNKSYSDPEIARLKHGHVTCEQLKKSVGEEIWNEYFKFAVIRNPYDRFVSYCAFMYRDREDFHENPQSFMYNSLLSRKTKKHILFKPQSEFVCDSHGELMIDYAGKYENLQESYDHICGQLGIKSQELQKVNTSKHLRYTDYYNDELKQMVAEMYDSDFINLGYPKETYM